MSEKLVLVKRPYQTWEDIVEEEIAALLSNGNAAVAARVARVQETYIDHGMTKELAAHSAVLESHSLCVHYGLPCTHYTEDEELWADAAQ